MRNLAQLQPRRIVIPLAWIAFAAIITSLSLASYLAKGNPLSEFSFANSIVWQSGWLIWAGLSFPAIYLARRYPIERHRFATGLLRHLLIGISVVSAHIGLEYSLNNPLRSLLDLQPQNNEFYLLGLFAYKSPINLLIYFAIVGGTNAYDNHLKLLAATTKASQLEAQLAQSQLQSLKMQLHPHFLFNAHHSIIALMLKGETETAIKMLTRLSDLLRITLRKKDQQTTSLKEELDTLELYLEIQKVRFKERLQVEINIPTTIQNAAVPHLLLQPIVENAIQHGIDPKTHGGQITVAASESDRRLTLVVSDNGIGMTQDWKTIPANAGIGLATTHARLQQLYGKQNADLKIESAPGQGTQVSISIPYTTKTWKP